MTPKAKLQSVVASSAGQRGRRTPSVKQGGRVTSKVEQGGRVTAEVKPGGILVSEAEQGDGLTPMSRLWHLLRDRGAKAFL